MKQKLAIFARWSSIAISVPALTGTLHFGWESVRLRYFTPQYVAHQPIETSNAILKTADTALGVASDMSAALSGLAQGITDGLAIGSLCLLVCCWAVWRLSRKLESRQGLESGERVSGGAAGATQSAE